MINSKTLKFNQIPVSLFPPPILTMAYDITDISKETIGKSLHIFIICDKGTVEFGGKIPQKKRKELEAPCHCLALFYKGVGRGYIRHSLYIFCYKL